jgi:hypothetical protein
LEFLFAFNVGSDELFVLLYGFSITFPVMVVLVVVMVMVMMMLLVVTLWSFSGLVLSFILKVFFMVEVTLRVWMMEEGLNEVKSNVTFQKIFRKFHS